jgi:rhamnose utilization protein RhaD (predicted bifunctional aldolase and dehydrogenase)
MLPPVQRDILQLPAELSPFSAFCAEVGCELAWVQGPGGNASIKRHGILWIKASGTWLSQALVEAIFVPVELQAVHAQIAQGDDTPLAPLPGWKLRPSLETTLHGLMPHAYVLHIHSIAALTWAVRTDAEACFERLLEGKLRFRFVPYARPGAKLTAATREALRASPCDYLVLGNHGVLLGAETLAELRMLLARSEALLAPEPTHTLGVARACDAAPRFEAPHGYRLPEDPRTHALAKQLLPRVYHGALYPDHTVFLGPVPIVAQPGDVQACIDAYSASFGERPVYVIVAGRGVCVSQSARPAVDAMLTCWALVLSGLEADAPLAPLRPEDNAELSSWEPERYRRALKAQCR